MTSQQHTDQKGLFVGLEQRALNSYSTQWDEVNDIKYNAEMKPSDSLFCGKQPVTKTHKERGHVRKKMMMAQDSIKITDKIPLQKNMTNGDISVLLLVVSIP